MPEVTKEQALELDVINIVAKQKDIENQEHELMQDPRFANFMRAQKEFKEQSDLFWESVKNEMVASGIKKISGEWGYVTVVEKTAYDVNEIELQPKFFKKVPDLKKIGDTYKLTDVAPKGVTPKVTMYITKKVK